MPQLMCARREVDKVDFTDERFVVCKISGVNAGGRRYEMGDVLPQGVLPPRALAEIYDTPLRLIEAMDYALADEALLAAMMSRPAADDAAEEVAAEEQEAESSVITGDSAPNKVGPGKGKKRK